MLFEKLEETLGNNNNTGDYRIVSNTKRDPSQKGPKKNELLKRFLDWIARRANESYRDRTFCPT